MAKGLSNAALLLCVLLSVLLLDHSAVTTMSDVRDQVELQEPAEKSRKSVTVRFSLVNEKSQEIPGASLQLLQKSGRKYLPLAVLTADVLGVLRVNLQAGVYLAVVRARDFARRSQFLSITQDEEVTLELSKAQRLKVEVVGDEGPLAGATVLVREAQRHASSSSERDARLPSHPHGRATSSAGLADFTDLSSPPYRVQIFAPGYESYDAEVESDLLVRLRRSSGLRVRVEHRGEGVANAEVTIAGAQIWPARQLIVDEQGEILLTGLSAGAYSLYAEKGSLVSPISRNVLVKQDGTESQVTLNLSPGSFLSLSVLSEDGVPVSDAQVLWSEFGVGFFTRHGKSNLEGLAQIGPLEKRRGQLAISAQGFISAYADVELEETQIIRLQRGGSINGRVVDPQGRPISGATVQALGTAKDGSPIYVTFQSNGVQGAHFGAMARQSRLLPAGELGVMIGPVPPLPLGRVTTQVGALTTGSDGRFSIQGIAPGKVQVFARHPLYLEGKSQTVELLSEQEQNLEVVLQSGQPFSGRVVDERDFPVAVATVRVVAAQFQRTLRTRSDGTFRMKAVPRQFRIAVSRAETPLVVALEEIVKVSPTNEESLFQLPPLREDAELIIFNSVQSPLVMARVRFESDSAREPRRLTRFSDEQGRVTLPAVRGLMGRLHVSAPTLPDLRETLVLQAEQKIELKKAWIIEGDIRGVRGRLPASGTLVRLEQGKLSVRVITDEYGHYIARGLSPGSLWLHAEHPEFGKAEGRFVPKVQGRAAAAELPVIELKPIFVVKGQVRGPDGKPVAGAWISEERISAYQGLRGPRGSLGVSDSAGNFSVELTRSEGAYLFAARPTQYAGFGPSISMGERSQLSGYQLLLDRVDELEPAARGTVLLTLEQDAAELVVFSIASQIQGDVVQGDILVAVEGRPVTSISQARGLLSGEPGSEVLLTLMRKNQQISRRVKREVPLRRAP